MGMLKRATRQPVQQAGADSKTGIPATFLNSTKGKPENPASGVRTTIIRQIWMLPVATTNILTKTAIRWDGAAAHLIFFPETENMLDLSQLSFHDATIAGIRRRGSDVSLDIEDIAVDDKLYRGTVILRKVRRITRNEKVVSDLGMETPDGQILRLSVPTSGHIGLVVQWNDFEKKTQFVTAYEFTSEAIEFSGLNANASASG